MKWYKIGFQILLAFAMIVIGAVHFTDPEPFVKIVPDYLPYHLELVYLSGFFEVLAGVGLLIPRVSRAAAWILVVLFITVFPANIYQAVNNIAVPALPHDPPLIWLRLPFQAFLVAWAWWFTSDNSSVQLKQPNE
jgi:uncharacterized membrane protein